MERRSVLALLAAVCAVSLSLGPQAAAAAASSTADVTFLEVGGPRLEGVLDDREQLTYLFNFSRNKEGKVSQCALRNVRPFHRGSPPPPLPLPSSSLSLQSPALRLVVTSDNASIAHPILITARQSRGISSWTLPYIESG